MPKTVKVRMLCAQNNQCWLDVVSTRDQNSHCWLDVVSTREYTDERHDLFVSWGLFGQLCWVVGVLWGWVAGWDLDKRDPFFGGDRTQAFI